MVMQPGSWVTETVRLKERIGRGGMAEVWRAEHVTLGTDVAVKYLPPQLARRPGAVQRFLAEARMASQLSDPYTVRVLDCVVRREPDGDESAFIVMELLEGEDLKRHLERVGVLSLGATASIVQQAAWALGTAHELGFIHRDVKPENIFLVSHCGRRYVKLLDFGVAKDRGAAQGITMIGVTLGTPQFMSPEQLEGARDLDARCDVWALAVVAYECLTGILPFEGKNVTALATAIHQRRVRPPSHLRGDLPASIDHVFAKAFQLDIRHRFQHARDLADALLDLGDGEHLAARGVRKLVPSSRARVPEHVA